MITRFGILAVLVCALMAAVSFQPSSASADKAVSITPTSGIVGTVVKAKLTGAPPNDFITVIFKGMADPILATGTTDAAGNADFTFTIPYALAGTYPIFFTDFKCSCQISTDFTVVIGNRTPTPVPTSTPVPSATPTRTPTPAASATPLAATPTATPSPQPTPQVPVLGAGDNPPGGGSRFHPGLYGLALLIMAAGFGVMNLGRLRNLR